MRAAPMDADGTGLGWLGFAIERLQRPWAPPRDWPALPALRTRASQGRDSPPLLLRRGRLMPDDPRHQMQKYKTSAENHAHNEESWIESTDL
jgi:hypothetical protein